MAAPVYRYLDFARSAPALDDLYRELNQLLAGFGFQYHAYTVFHTPKTRDITGFVVHYDQGATTRTNYRADWIEHYDLEDYYFVDPIVDRARSSSTPFRWSELEQGELSRKQRQLFGDARDAGMRTGMTVPLHGPFEGLCALNLCGDLDEAELERHWPQYKVDLFTVATFTHEAIMQAATAPNALADIRLSNRERECLSWTAQGKTLWEVSQILGIGQDTARSYLREAQGKLGVHSKHHAVVKAIAAGLIAP